MSRGVDPDRLVFSDVAPKDEHIRRCQLADLFLDTDFGSAGTGCDLLWAGTPMVSKLGECMHSRIGGSLLKACGLGELVVNTWEEYKELAVRLACESQTLLHYRLMLEEGRENCSLFDTRKWVYNLEHGLLQIVHGLWAVS